MKVHIRASSISKGLLVLGGVSGAAAGIALALGVRLDQLPSWMITVGMYKLAFIAAAGLLVVGALVGRAAHGTRRESAQHPDAQLNSGSAPRMERDGTARRPDAAYRHRRDP